MILLQQVLQQVGTLLRGEQLLQSHSIPIGEWAYLQELVNS